MKTAKFALQTHFLASFWYHLSLIWILPAAFCSMAIAIDQLLLPKPSKVTQIKMDITAAKILIKTIDHLLGHSVISNSIQRYWLFWWHLSNKGQDRFGPYSKVRSSLLTFAAMFYFTQFSCISKYCFSITLCFNPIPRPIQFTWYAPTEIETQQTLMSALHKGHPTPHFLLIKENQWHHPVFPLSKGN